MDRVRAYVDGFNLYYGLREKHGRKYHWLDLEGLAQRLLKPGQSLDRTTYFTARVRNQPASQQRQTVYLEALAAHSSQLLVVEGRYQEKQKHCRSCGATWTEYEEKETDVSVATALLEDAANDRFDVALVISADSDLCPAVRAVGRLAPEKRIIAAFPPKRRSEDLRREVAAGFTIGDAKLRQSQLPTIVVNTAGRKLARPQYWH